MSIDIFFNSGYAGEFYRTMKMNDYYIIGHNSQQRYTYQLEYQYTDRDFIVLVYLPKTDLTYSIDAILLGDSIYSPDKEEVVSFVEHQNVPISAPITPRPDKQTIICIRVSGEVISYNEILYPMEGGLDFHSIQLVNMFYENKPFNAHLRLITGFRLQSLFMEREGYLFTGWELDGNLLDESVFPITVDKDYRFTAIWSPIEVPPSPTPTPPPSQPPPDPDYKYGIDYSQPDLIVPSDTEDSATINLHQETLLLPEDYYIGSYSLDGGRKWKNGATPFLSSKFPKLFSKDITLWLSNEAIEKTTKKPPKEAQMIKFPKILKRPKTPKLTINYAIAANEAYDSTLAISWENPPSMWVLAEKDGRTAIKKNIQIGVAAGTSGAVPDEFGFGWFYDGMKNGIPVMELTGTKVMKTAYVYRVAPTQNGSTYKAASKPRKIKASSELKPTKYKVKPTRRNKDGTLKAPAIVKLKAGSMVRLVPTSGEATLRRYTAKTDLNVQNKQGTASFWIAATAKKPASKKQVIELSG